MSFSHLPSLYSYMLSLIFHPLSAKLTVAFSQLFYRFFSLSSRHIFREAPFTGDFLLRRWLFWSLQRALFCFYFFNFHSLLASFLRLFFTCAYIHLFLYIHIYVRLRFSYTFVSGLNCCASFASDLRLTKTETRSRKSVRPR